MRCACSWIAPSIRSADLVCHRIELEQAQIIPMCAIFFGLASGGVRFVGLLPEAVMKAVSSEAASFIVSGKGKDFVCAVAVDIELIEKIFLLCVFAVFEVLDGMDLSDPHPPVARVLFENCKQPVLDLVLRKAHGADEQGSAGFPHSGRDEAVNFEWSFGCDSMSVAGQVLAPQVDECVTFV